MGAFLSMPMKAIADVKGQADVNVRMLEELRNVVGVAEGAIAANANADVNAQADVNVRLLEKLRHIVGVAEGAVTANANADVRVCDALRNIVGVAQGAIRADANTDVRLLENLQEIVGIAKGAINVNSHVNVSTALVPVSLSLVAIVVVVFIFQFSNVNQHVVAMFQVAVRAMVVAVATAAIVYFLLLDPKKKDNDTVPYPSTAPPLPSARQYQQHQQHQQPQRLLQQGATSRTQVHPPGVVASEDVFSSAVGPNTLGHFRNHRVVSDIEGHRVWLNVNNKKLVYENMDEAAKAAATVKRYPDRVKGHHYSPTFGTRVRHERQTSL